MELEVRRLLPSSGRELMRLGTRITGELMGLASESSLPGIRFPIKDSKTALPITESACRNPDHPWERTSTLPSQTSVCDLRFSPVYMWGEYGPKALNLRG